MQHLLKKMLEVMQFFFFFFTLNEFDLMLKWERLMENNGSCYCLRYVDVAVALFSSSIHHIKKHIIEMMLCIWTQMMWYRDRYNKYDYFRGIILRNSIQFACIFFTCTVWSNYNFMIIPKNIIANIFLKIYHFLLCLSESLKIIIKIVNEKKTNSIFLFLPFFE